MGFVSAAESAGGDTDNGRGDVGDTHYFGVRNGDVHDNGFDDNGDCRHGFDDSDNAGGVAAGADAAVAATGPGSTAEMLSACDDITPIQAMGPVNASTPEVKTK